MSFIFPFNDKAKCVILLVKPTFYIWPNLPCSYLPLNIKFVLYCDRTYPFITTFISLQPLKFYPFFRSSHLRLQNKYVKLLFVIVTNLILWTFFRSKRLPLVRTQKPAQLKLHWDNIGSPLHFVCWTKVFRLWDSFPIRTSKNKPSKTVDHY